MRSAEYDPDVSGRGHVAHEKTVAAVADHIGPSFRRGTLGINHDGGWSLEGFHIAEVKSITTRNEVGQLRKGLGQLLHNRFKAERHGVTGVQGYLIAEREPANSPLWQALCSTVGLVFTWPERFSEDVPRP